MTADLHDLLEDAVSDIEPRHALPDIRRRTRQAGRRRVRTLGAAAAGLAAACVVTAGVVVTGDGGRPDGASEPGPAAPTTAADPFGPADGVTVPVYYVGDTPAGPRLFREFHRVDPAERGRAEVLLATTASAVDPDYRTAWPAAVTDGAGFDGIGDDGVISVTIPDALRDRPTTTTGTEARLAVDALLRTVRGSFGVTAPVLFHGQDGRRAPTVLGVAVPAGGLRPLPDVTSLAEVNISDPQEGHAVSDVFTARGVALSPEGNVLWSIEDPSGGVVLAGQATAPGSYDRLNPWRTRIDVSDLAPGTYTFVASTDDPSGGTEGFGSTSDTRTIVVE